MARDPFQGIGKTETGFDTHSQVVGHTGSRQEPHRFVYRVTDDLVDLLQAGRYHY